MYMSCQACSTAMGSEPKMKSLKSLTQAITAPALPSSVASPQPTTPSDVSNLTNTYGRSDCAVRETPNTFRRVILFRDPTECRPSFVSAIAPRLGGAAGTRGYEIFFAMYE